MHLTFRWYGDADPVALEEIKQIPGVTGIVSAIYDTPVGQAWSLESIMKLKERVAKSGLKLMVIESVPVHEDIKLGLPARDKYIENFCTTIRRLAQADIRTVIYNFMPVFDWMRTDLTYPLPDGSNTLIYEQTEIEKIDPKTADLSLPGWDIGYSREELLKIMELYSKISKEQLWDNLKYFLEKVIPVCDEVGVAMGIHPDDPPWSIFGLPRIITGYESLKRLLSLVDSKNNGLALCSGSLGADPKNDLPRFIREFGDRIHFGHVRNVKITGDKCFEESAHPTPCGSLDIYEIMKAYYDVGYTGPIRPDHGRMIWGETGKPGYGLYDRALGAMYIQGLWEGITRSNN